MNIETRTKGEICVLHFEGNFDSNTASDAESVINELIEDGKLKIVANFENLNFISSAGLRVLLATAKRLNASGGDLRVCCLNQTVQEVFDISGFGTILTVNQTEDEAIRSI
ncbi:MAG: STAS domain-containing protein [Xanthomonadales bacterium]|nr:STAS domain-containing protein [Xanthomonadales bacterium]